jgi:hypothetical protein
VNCDTHAPARVGQNGHMNTKYIVIRNRTSDKLTMHSTTCSVVARHFGPRVDAAKIEAFASDTHAEALEAVEFHGGKTKICDCAKL